MNRSTLFFFFVLVIIVVAIARCNSRSRLAEERSQSTSPVSSVAPSAPPSPLSTPVPSATATPLKTPPIEIAKAAAQIQPAVVSLSIFEASGKLLRSGTGVLISSSGKILTARSLMEGAAHAIAKTADDRIHNVGGILAELQSEDLAVLEMETKDRVSSVTPNPNAAAEEEGTRVAVVQSPLGREKVSILEGTISKRHRSLGSEWLQLSIPVKAEGIGAPVVNGRGEIVGLVTRGPGDPAVVVRTPAAINSVVMRVPDDGKAKWLAEETPPSPAEGPLVRKVPLAQNPQGQQSRLIYSPAPAYPKTGGALKGSGRFKLTFDANGRVKNITILRSTQNGALDQAAVEALRRWKATPGAEWELNVPITFQ